MAFGSFLYKSVFRRTSTFALAVVVGVLVFERGFEQGTEELYNHLNRGKLWKDIKHKYEKEE
ncbi:cytochrome b-c1 complex subunit 9 [Pelodytes ibericus]